jgi:hypothetical protein
MKVCLLRYGMVSSPLSGGGFCGRRLDGRPSETPAVRRRWHGFRQRPRDVPRRALAARGQLVEDVGSRLVLGQLHLEDFAGRGDQLDGRLTVLRVAGVEEAHRLLVRVLEATQHGFSSQPGKVSVAM